MKNEGDAWVDDALEALAAEDAQVKAPARLQEAVLGEWDRLHTGSRGPAMREGAPRVLIWTAASAAAAAALAIVVLRPGPLHPLPPQTMPAGAVPSPQRSIAAVPAAPAPQAVERSSTRLSAAQDPRRIVEDTGYVIVPGPLVDSAARHLVRARMSSRALATLGMPMVNPDADGLVEVEMLVGDDGVAQSIRHAAFVSDQPETGGGR